MRVLLFGYGYMGKIRYRVLQQQPEVTGIKVKDQ